MINRLQEKQAELQRAVKSQGNDYQYYDINNRSIPQDVVKRWQTKIVKLKKEVDSMISENKSYELLLREKYLLKEGKVRDYVYSRTK